MFYLAAHSRIGSSSIYIECQTKDSNEVESKKEEEEKKIAAAIKEHLHSHYHGSDDFEWNRDTHDGILITTTQAKFTEQPEKVAVRAEFFRPRTARHFTLVFVYHIP